jgi:hypothetical protein
MVFEVRVSKKSETFISNLYNAHFLNLMPMIFIVIYSELLFEYIAKEAMFAVSYDQSLANLNDRTVRQKSAKFKK